jgi:hypothetical protein
MPRKVIETSHPYELMGADYSPFSIFMLLREKIRHDNTGFCHIGHAGSQRAQAGTRYNRVGSRWLTASSGLLSRNSSSDPEKTLCESKIHWSGVAIV